MVSKKHKLKPGDEKSFPFFKLTPELRVNIYELALTDDQVILDTNFMNNRRKVFKVRGRYENGRLQRREVKTLIPNLLAVSQQVHHEAIGILYSQPIIASDMLALHSFLVTIGPMNRPRVRDMTVKNWGASGCSVHKAIHYAALSLLAESPNLQRLHLDCRISRNRTGTDLARNVYRNAANFLWACGRARRDRNAGIETIKLHECNYEVESGVSDADGSPAVNKELYRKELERLLKVDAEFKPDKKPKLGVLCVCGHCETRN